MINIKKGIKVEHLITLLEPLKEMELEFFRSDDECGGYCNCSGSLDVIGNKDGELTLQIQVD